MPSDRLDRQPPARSDSKPLVRHLLIVEPWAHGHHFSLYLREVLVETAHRGWRVRLLTTSDALEHPAMTDIRGEFDGRFEISLMPKPYQRIRPGVLSLLLDQWDYHRAVRSGWRAIAGTDFDVVLAMDLDSMDKMIGWLGSPTGTVPLVGVLVHAKFHLSIPGRSGLRDRLLRVAFWRLLRRPEVAAVCPIDPRLKEALRGGTGRLVKKIVPIAEPTQAVPSLSQAEARQRLRIPADAQVVLAYGALTLRKGLPELLMALEEAPAHCVLVLAGSPDADVRELLDSEQVRCLRLAHRAWVIDRYIEASEQPTLFAAADVLWLGYAAGFDGQSALLPIAAGHGLPVIARAGTSIGRLVHEHRLGIALQPEERGDVIAALRDLRDDSGMRGELAAGMARFAASRDRRYFAGTLCDAVASACSK